MSGRKKPPPFHQMPGNQALPRHRFGIHLSRNASSPVVAKRTIKMSQFMLNPFIWFCVVRYENFSASKMPSFRTLRTTCKRRQKQIVSDRCVQVDYILFWKAALSEKALDFQCEMAIFTHIIIKMQGFFKPE